MTHNTLTLTDRELGAIASINESGRQPIVLIHGLWLHAASWSRWEDYLEDRGYAPLSLDWPGDAPTMAGARAGSDALAGVGVQDVVERSELAIEMLRRRPALVGHSFGGLVVQILAGRGLAAATAAIDPAPFKGIRGLPVSVLRSSFAVLRNPGNRRRTVALTPSQFTYGFANAVPPAESQALYDAFHVPAPGRPVFQAASANFTPSKATQVDRANPARGPLAIVSGSADHTVPPSLAKAAYKKQSKNLSPTELVTIDNAGHSLVIDHRWQEVAEATTDFFERHGAGAQLGAR